MTLGVLLTCVVGFSMWQWRQTWTSAAISCAIDSEEDKRQAAEELFAD
jgi:hypothetical protein